MVKDQKKELRQLLWFLPIFGTILFHNPSSGILVGVLETFVTVLIFYGWIYLIKHKTLFLISISFGLIVYLLFLTVSNFLTAQSYGWVQNPTSRMERINEYEYKIYPLNELNSWALYSIGNQGSGEIVISAKFRSEKKLNVKFSVFNFEQPSLTQDQCEILTTWTSCSLHFVLSSRKPMVIGIGGYGTWKKSSFPIEIKEFQVHVVQPPSFFDKIQFMERVKGFSFNENAFGAHISVIGVFLIIFYFNINKLSAFLILIPAFFLIFLSGSRGALLAMIIGLLFSYIAKSKFFKILPFLFAILIGLFYFNFFEISKSNSSLSQSSIRSLNFFDKETAQTRLELWRLATKSWLESPRTVFFGVGDLESAMKKQFDERSLKFGLSREIITHTHNLWLQTLGQSGLVGVIALLLAWYRITSQAWKSRNAAVLGILSTIFVLNLTDYLFFYAPVYLLFWFCAAYSQVYEQPHPLPTSKIV